jgi:hypothetical protein
MRYRFKLPHTEKDVAYLIRWDIVTEFADGAVSVSHQEEEVLGTGLVVYSTERQIYPPRMNGVISVTNPRAEVLPTSAGNGAGGAAPGSGTWLRPPSTITTSVASPADTPPMAASFPSGRLPEPTAVGNDTNTMRKAEQPRLSLLF